MIKSTPWDHSQGEVRRSVAPTGGACAATSARLKDMFDQHYDLVWRSLRRFGVRTHDVDDAAQEVFIVAARRLADIEDGKERAFLFSTAYRVAADARRARARRPAASDDALADITDPHPAADVLFDRLRARELLDQVLDGMSDEQRAVFVLFELEGMTMAAIAEDLDLPGGTVASRLRRAREHYQRQVDRLRAALARTEAV